MRVGRKRRPEGHRQYSFIASDKTREKLERYSTATGLSMSQVIEQAIDQLQELTATVTEQRIFKIEELEK